MVAQLDRIILFYTYCVARKNTFLKGKWSILKMVTYHYCIRTAHTTHWSTLITLVLAKPVGSPASFE
jgi:hypothetical protein